MTVEALMRETIPAEWTEQNTSGANAVVTQDHTGETAFRHVVTWIAASFSGAPAGAVLEIIEDPGGTPVTRFHLYVPANGQTNPDPVFINFSPNPILIGEGLDVRISLGAGGSGITSKVCMGGYTFPDGLRV